MKVIEPITKSVEETVDIICDMCGKSCKGEMNYEVATLEAYWGYSSKKDLDKWECHLCESCADKVKGFIESQGGKVRVRVWELNKVGTL
jgi:hypothetical protein